MQYFSRWNVNQNSPLVSIYLLSEEVHVLGHVLAALGAGVVWVGHGAALADLDAGGAVQAGQAGQACGAVSREYSLHTNCIQTVEVALAGDDKGIKLDQNSASFHWN